MKNIYDDEIFFSEYAKMSRSQEGLKGAGEWYQFKRMLPDFSRKKVLDLGCGYGWHSYYAIQNGADYVLGIDMSEKMIQEACRRNAHDHITYQVKDILKYEYPVQEFDCVVSNLVLHYIEDLKFVYKNVYQTLKVGGVFVFNIEHPTFTAGVSQTWKEEDGELLYWPVDNYFYSGLRETEFLGQKVLKYHHTLTEILQGLLDVGFSIESVCEATPSKEMQEIPEMKDEMRRPMMLMIKAMK